MAFAVSLIKAFQVRKKSDTASAPFGRCHTAAFFFFCLVGAPPRKTKTFLGMRLRLTLYDSPATGSARFEAKAVPVLRRASVRLY